MNNARRLGFAALLSGALISLLSHSAESLPDDPAQWVKLLGSDSFEERTAADVKLREMGSSARTALESAAASPDAEVSARVKVLLPRAKWLEPPERHWLEKYGSAFGASGSEAALFANEPPVAAVQTKGPATYSVVDATLDWLAKGQEDDGHWNSLKHGAQVEADLEQTSLALLAILGAGHSEKAGTYRQTVRRGIEWLRKQQRDDGAFCKSGQTPDGVAHALCGLALAEAAGMSRIEETKDAAQKATDYSTQVHQARLGKEKFGFGRKANSDAPDLFTTTLFVMQLSSAYAADLNVPADSHKGVERFLDTLEVPRLQGYCMNAGCDPSPRATILGCYCRSQTGKGREEVTPYLEHAMENAKVLPTADENSDAFINLIGTRATFYCGGDLWKRWNEQTKEKLLDAAHDKGGAGRGSWPPYGRWTGAGRVLATSLNAMCFEVYYAYVRLPCWHAEPRRAGQD